MRKSWVTAASLFALLASGVVAAPARAQHGTAGWGVMPMEPRTSAMLEQQTAEFDQPGRSGVWQTWGPRLEYATLPWLSFAVRTAIARVDYSTGESAFGLSDTELVVEARVARIRALRASVSAGLSGELPTGDADSGTGNGHVSLFPFATFATMPSRVFMLHVMAGDRIVLGETDHDTAAHEGHEGRDAPAPAAHGSVLMPHERHELSAHAGACFTFAPVVISPGIEWMQAFTGSRDAFVVAQLELALVPRRELRLAVGFDLPLTSEPRFEWRGRLMAALVW